LIADRGWRIACWSLGLLVIVALAPLNLLLRRKPADLGLKPDGDSACAVGTFHRLAAAGNASVDWTLPRALRTPRFWWLALRGRARNPNQLDRRRASFETTAFAVSSG
jgi:hypothetical protein